MPNSEWLRLDTAAKIFPPATTKRDTMVFRLVCELNEMVDKNILQHALDASLEGSPFYRCVLRNGLFWHYLEKTNIQPIVREEFATPCAPLYDENRADLLFSLTYFRKRINLEMYHSLADAVGASKFFKTIVCRYLMEKHSEVLSKNINLSFDEDPVDQKSVDAFDTYYEKEKFPKLEKKRKAFFIAGTRFPEARFGVIEGHVSTSALMKKSRELNATVSELLVSVLIWSFRTSMKRLDKRNPVAVKIPINLRKCFSSCTARNFLGFFDAAHNFSKQGEHFEDILANVKNIFKIQLTPQKLAEQLSWYTAFDHTSYIKIMPLALKSLVIKNVVARKNTKASASFSNIGVITMPPELSPYIRLFNLICSIDGIYVGVCSFLDITTIGFSSSFVNASVQRSFFRMLTGFGIDVEIVANTQIREATE